jgi:DNA-binding HxlR family transcriptional regulator
MPAFLCRGQTWNNPVQLVLATIGGKWKMPILWRLKDGPRRFSDLKRSLAKSAPGGGITDRALVLPLRELVEHGLVVRTVHPTVPPQVEYAITPLGLEAIPVIQALQGYGQRLREADGTVAAPPP